MKKEKIFSVLLVEDNPSDARLLQERLLLSGAEDIELSIVQSLHQATAWLKDNHADVILLDLSLPDSSGIDTVKRIEGVFPSMPIVVLTGAEDENIGIEAVRLGVQDYLTKDKVDGLLVTRAVRYALERKKKQDELAKLNRTLRALSNSNQTMLHAKDETQILDAVCKIVIQDCGYSMVWIGFAQDDPGKTVRPAASAGFEEGYLGTLNVTCADTERGRGPTGTAIRTSKPCICRNMLTDPNFAPWRQEAIKRGYASSIALPLLSGSGVLGAMTIYSKQTDPFSEDEIRLLTELANDLSQGIAAMRLRVAHAQNVEALRQARDELELRVKQRTAELVRTVGKLEAEAQVRIEAERALRHTSDQLRNLTGELIMAEHRERHRLAGVLHDHLQQLLVAAKFQLTVPAKITKQELMALTERIKQLIDDSIRVCRSLVSQLSPPVLHEGSLIPALEWLGNWMTENHGLYVELQADNRVQALKKDVSVLLFESVRELLLNAAKHSGVKKASVALRLTDKNTIEVVVADNGVGFDPAMRKDNGTGGFGLFSIAERLRQLGGEMIIDSQPGRGSRFTLTVPIMA